MRVSVVRQHDNAVLYSGTTVQEAEAFIAGLEQCIPDDVHAGAFSIDPDEEALAAYRHTR